MRPRLDLQTQRLWLEPITHQHLPVLVELNSDSEVMRFLIGRAATPTETHAEWEQRLSDRTDVARGLGYWAGFLDGNFVGWWACSSFPSDPTRASLGYRLRRAVWGHGLATEGSQAMVAHAFTVPGIEQVVAATMAVNRRSRRVMEKVGMVHTRTWFATFDSPLPGTELGEVGYAITREQYAQRQGD